MYVTIQMWQKVKVPTKYEQFFQPFHNNSNECTVNWSKIEENEELFNKILSEILPDYIKQSDNWEFVEKSFLTV